MRDFQPNHFVLLAPRTVVTASVDAVAVDDDVTVSKSLHVDFEADSAAFASADKSMDQTDGDATTVSVDSPGTPSLPASASDAMGVTERDVITSQTVNSLIP